jgi:ubiquinone/menaquinone biosynthesis C-methylase UbiE
MRRYDLTAEMYDERYIGEQKAKYDSAMANIKVDQATVLDVGCGSGLFFSQVARKAKIIVGVDISRKLLLQAREKGQFFRNVLVLQADADQLPFADASFDAVFAFTVLQNLPKPSRTLGEFKRVAKHDGRVVVTGLKKAFPLGKFMDLLEAAGFKLISFVDEEELKCYVAVLANTCTSAT